MKILITGGNGFVGKYISVYLLQRGYEVVATFRNNKPAYSVQGIKYIYQNLSEPLDIDGDYDAIIHTACLHPGKSDCMEEYIKDNVDSARNIVHFAKNNNIKTIIYFSSKSIYGNTNIKDICEESEKVNQDMYGLSKLIAEKIFQDAKDINTLGLRTPGIIGRESHDIWLVKIAEMLKKNETIQIVNHKTKNLVWIDDIAKFIDKMLIQSYNGQKYKYNVVNLACKEYISNNEIVDCMKKRMNSKSAINCEISEEMLGSLNVNKAVGMGFEPLHPLDIINLFVEN